MPALGRRARVRERDERAPQTSARSGYAPISPAVLPAGEGEELVVLARQHRFEFRNRCNGSHSAAEPLIGAADGTTHDVAARGNRIEEAVRDESFTLHV